MENDNEILEGKPVIYIKPCEAIIPDDAELLFSTTSFQFFKYKDKSTNENNIGIRVTSYHPGELKIPLHVLEELIKQLKKEI